MGREGEGRCIFWIWALRIDNGKKGEHEGGRVERLSFDTQRVVLHGFTCLRHR